VAKKLNPNLAKIHLSYTVGEVADLFSVHKNTVRAWINQHGLPINDDLKPILILGSHLRLFLQDRRTKNKKKCLPHELYCLKCRKPKVPAGNMAEYIPMNETKGRLISLCPTCDSFINKFISLSQIKTIQDKLDITIPKEQ